MKVAVISDIHSNLHALEARRRSKVEFRRVDYDVEAAAQAIRESELPDYYADELIAGGAPEKVGERSG